MNVNGAKNANHSDVYQPQGAIGHLYINGLTASSNYQGLFLSPQAPIAAISLNRVNLSYSSGGDPSTPVTYLLWLLDSAATSSPPPTDLTDVYVTPRSNQGLQQAIYPAPGVVNSSGGAVGAASSDGWRSAFFPALPVTGAVISGNPPAGDFVEAAN